MNIKEMTVQDYCSNLKEKNDNKNVNEYALLAKYDSNVVIIFSEASFFHF